MDRIKDWGKVKSGRQDMVLVEVVPKTKSLIIMPDKTSNEAVNWDYAKVLALGDKVTNIEVGDLVLNYDGGANVFEVENKKYANLLSGMCTVVISPDNFKDK